MNLLNFIFAFACSVALSTTHAASITGSNKKPPIFSLERPIACEETLTKDKFIVAIRKVSSDELKLTALFHCPRIYARIGELSETDVRIQNNEMPQVLRNEFQRLLDQLPKGSLQADNDSSFVGCIDQMRKLIQSSNICSNKDICIAQDMDNFLQSTQSEKACTYEFMGERLKRMIDVVKAYTGLMASDASFSRKELVEILLAIIDAAPYENAAEMAKTNAVKEKTKLDARAKLESLLGVSTKESVPPQQDSNATNSQVNLIQAPASSASLSVPPLPSAPSTTLNNVANNIGVPPPAPITLNNAANNVGVPSQTNPGSVSGVV